MRDGNNNVALLLGLGVFVLAVVSLGAAFYLSVHFQNPSEHVGRLIETCSNSWKVGFGTLTAAFGVWARAHLAARRVGR
jgi:hypothetical protein